ncbi:methionyl-tRNA formyltransferase [Rhodococcoides corynebacterioides]|uniref:Methionyl-tRNA formyltransferase n=1 Tax=Rhodococcoides corynebacterioides TaxID=53972 RepID=A0ABS7P1E9_9NOCA|nr:methionyl-tRNA formyltransferase [Rhodococcus corynebacterioides]MBY6366229.1 methionyl-tRNA formyltransferase [Rhodococcus corynebacterioides]MBY6406860.1 methionyl-tRNA formyltransferase [Rhodococcus corynebacterioides]
MRLVFAGTPEPALPSLRRLIASSRHEVVGVLTRPDTVAGRGRRAVRSPVAQLADEHGIPVLQPARPGDPDAVRTLTEWAPDCCPVVAYGALLRPPLLDLPRHGWVNLHFSLLPAWRGAAPVQAALAAGDEVTGASTFRIEEGLDTGPLFGVVTETVRSDDTAGDLLARLAESGAGLLEATMDGLEEGALTAVPQSTDGVSVAPKVTVDAARVDFTLPAVAVDRHVRSVTPAPGAWTEVNGLRVKLGPVTVTDETLPAGVVEVRKRAVLVGTATTAVELSRVQPPGKKPMAATDWARGARDIDGTVIR